MINVVHDTLESERISSGLPLEPHSVDPHIGNGEADSPHHIAIAAIDAGLNIHFDGRE